MEMVYLKNGPASSQKVPASMVTKTDGAIQLWKDDTVKRTPIARPSFGHEGKPIRLLSNHFAVKLSGIDTVFYQFSVSIKSDDDDKVVDGKGIVRNIIDKMLQAYSSELAAKEFVYDGEKCLFTVGPLPQNNFEFTVILEETSSRAVGGSPGHGSPGQGDKKRAKRSHLPKKFVVGISYAAKIPLRSVALALQGSDSDHAQDALRVLNIVLRQQQAKRGCLLVRQSFFSDIHRNLVDLTGGVSGCRGLHSSFRTTKGGLSLNMDVSTTMIVTPGPVVDFLLATQNVRDIRDVDWPKARKMLKHLRVKAKHNNMEFKIIGLSDQPCSRQIFPMKVWNGSSEGQAVDITVQEYFKSKQVHLAMPFLPCLDVGKLKRPNYLSIELANMVSLQRYTKALSSQQRTTLVEKSQQKPQDGIRVVNDAVKSNRYDDDPIFSSCGITIEKQVTRVDGRVLCASALVVGNSEDCIPNRGRWNYNNKRLFEPVKIDHWAIINFSARCDTSHISRDLINCGRSKGIIIERPFSLVDEDSQAKRCTPVVRVERMFEKFKANLPWPPEFLLCVLPERKNCDLYGPWKKKNLYEMGIVTQCVVSNNNMNDQYFTNVLLKINAKLGGMNSKLALEHRQMIPIVNKIHTLISGMNVSHGSPGRLDIPSIAAVVGSRCWPLISWYRASVRTHSPKVEMIDSLFKPLDDGKDDGIIRSGGDFPKLEKGSIPWDLKSPNLSVDKNVVKVPDFNSSCSQHPERVRTVETRRAPEVMNAQSKHDRKADADSANVLQGDLMAPKLKSGIMPWHVSIRCYVLLLLAACLVMGNIGVAAEDLKPQCSVTSFATNIRLFCGAQQPSSLCCDSIRAAVLSHGGLLCLCLVGGSPDVIAMGFTASDLLRINSRCSGLDWSSDDYQCTEPNDDKLDRDNARTQYNESSHTVDAQRERVEQPHAEREHNDHDLHPSNSVVSVLIGLVILLIVLLAAAILLIHKRQQLRIGDVVNMARVIMPPVVAAAGPAAVAALPIELRAAAAAALPPEGEAGQANNVPAALLAVAQLVVPPPVQIGMAMAYVVLATARRRLFR